LKEFNDLKTEYPRIAEEADGWDPSTVIGGSNLKLGWKCKHGHKWKATVINRTGQGAGCPICSGHQIQEGFNDLATTHPEIASQADGWDPRKVSKGHAGLRDWRCLNEHTWKTSVNSRTNKDLGCPFCSGQRVWTGFNDLKTEYPQVAIEAEGWDPSTVRSGSESRARWKCQKGHIWFASIKNRTINGSGCPVCCEKGFDPSLQAWFYLMHRPGEMQIGITNDPKRRIKTHERYGWVLLDLSRPESGKVVYEVELRMKQWIKSNLRAIEGTTENWSTTSMEVQSLAELKARSGIETDLF
jgi:hypothetical protein